VKEIFEFLMEAVLITAIDIISQNQLMKSHVSNILRRGVHNTIQMGHRLDVRRMGTSGMKVKTSSRIL